MSVKNWKKMYACMKCCKPEKTFFFHNLRVLFFMQKKFKTQSLICFQNIFLRHIFKNWTVSKCKALDLLPRLNGIFFSLFNFVVNVSVYVVNAVSFCIHNHVPYHLISKPGWSTSYKCPIYTLEVYPFENQQKRRKQNVQTEDIKYENKNSCME